MDSTQFTQPEEKNNWEDWQEQEAGKDAQINQAIEIAAKLQTDIEKWYLDSSEQIKKLKEICNKLIN